MLKIKNGRMFFKQPKKLIFKDSISDTPPSEMSTGANQNIIPIGIISKRATKTIKSVPELNIAAGLIDSGFAKAPKPPIPLNKNTPAITAKRIITPR